jgi:hypothetical protein
MAGSLTGVDDDADADADATGSPRGFCLFYRTAGVPSPQFRRAGA